MTTTHQFTGSLALSAKYADAAWWSEVYHQAFPTLQAMVNVRGDGWAQRGGIDRQLVLADGTVLKVDEKVRSKVYPDFCLEAFSDVDRKTPGWLDKNLTCDYIAYAFIPTRTCYLLPYQLLCRAWRIHRVEWWRDHRIPNAHNEEAGRKWQTANVGVPIPAVMEAIRDAMVVYWTANAA